MMMRVILAVAALATASPALAKELVFRATLRGDTPSTTTGSKASGAARIVVDTETKTVDVNLNVVGLKPEDLRASLVKAPLGPIHLHLYGSTDHGPNSSASLVLPVPYGPAYSPTTSGFQVRMKAYPYATGAQVVNASAGFDEFVSSMQSGKVVLNIHTNRFPDGEISGDVVPAAGS